MRRDRLIVAAGLFAIAALAWLWLLMGAGTDMSILAMSRPSLFPGADSMPSPAEPWPAAGWIIMAGMWWIMMIAMMIPSAAPMILLHARVTRQAQRKGQLREGGIPSGAFLAGYLLVWLGFSVAATGLQWLAERAGLLSQPMMWSINAWLAGGLLVAAGLYQLSPAKRACLEHCRSPVEFLSRHWRANRSGALRMGIDHGAFCLGCCWSLMALLFVGGIMNLYWIAGLAIVVLAEKLLPGGQALARTLGIAFIAAGIWVVTTAA